MNELYELLDATWVSKVLCCIVLFTWTKECDSLFHCVEEALASAPVLAHTESENPFVLGMDARNVGTGAILSQVHQGRERVMAYYSQALTKTERNYWTTRHELSAIVKAVNHFHLYLYWQEVHH